MTPEELIAIIEQSPELQKAIRKYVLTEEFLAVPARLGRIESDVAYLQAGQVRLEQGQARLEQEQARLEDRMNKLDGRMDRLDGYRYEQKAIENCRSIITRQTGMGRVKIRFSQANHPEDPEMTERMNQAADRGEISQGEEAALWSADLIASATNRATGERVNIIAKASISLSDNYIDCARERAATLAKATGEPTIAMVICARAEEPRIGKADQDNIIILRMPDEYHLPDRKPTPLCHCSLRATSTPLFPCTGKFHVCA